MKKTFRSRLQTDYVHAVRGLSSHRMLQAQPTALFWNVNLPPIRVAHQRPFTFIASGTAWKQLI